MIKLELTDQMVAVIGAALGNYPFKDAAPVVAEIQKQIGNQQKINGVENLQRGDVSAVKDHRGSARSLPRRTE